MSEFQAIKNYLYSYIGTGWTITSGKPVALYYLSQLQSAQTKEELVDLAYELGIDLYNDCGTPLFN